MYLFTQLGCATTMIQISLPHVALVLQTVIVAVNVAAITAFGIDKQRSKKGAWRIPESRLLLIAFFGPFGAYSGMLLFRHKTRKLKFLLVPLFLCIQISLLIYFYRTS